MFNEHRIALIYIYFYITMNMDLLPRYYCFVRCEINTFLLPTLNVQSLKCLLGRFQLLQTLTCEFVVEDSLLHQKMSQISKREQKTCRSFKKTTKKRQRETHDSWFISTSHLWGRSDIPPHLICAVNQLCSFGGLVRQLNVDITSPNPQSGDGSAHCVLVTPPLRPPL